MSQEAATITDLHSSSNIAEVEIISLLEEKIPLYKLRADTATGYGYDDWLGSSLGTVLEEGGEEEGRYDLSPEMMEETLKYFTLCGDRVVQMTKTYNDIDAVTRLLEEKEKDLELAAKIGQSLLQQNKQLDVRIEALEEQSTILSDQNTQLHHDIKLKNELLRIYTNDVSYSDSEDESSWSDRSQGSKPSVQSQFINVGTLQKKVRNLEEENLHLRMETADLHTTATSIEEKEKELMDDCVKQLGDAQGRESILREELSKKYEETARQQEDITHLLAQLVDLQNKVKKLTIENEDMQQNLQAAKESQADLTDEVQNLRDKYDECHEMLIESQQAVKEIHRRSLPQGKVPSYSALNPLPVFPLDSLAAELVNTVEQELGVEQHLTGKGRKDHQRRVMRTVKAAKASQRASRQSSISDLSAADLYSRRTSPSSSLISLAGSPRSEQYEGDNESVSYSPEGKNKPLCKAGIPGSNDLETALRRISLRRQNNEAERKYEQEEKERLLNMTDIEQSTDMSGDQTPTCTTPGSMWSYDGFGYSGYAAHSFKAFMPEKLQIVKPMEGSMTLYHWQRLATPHMASMLDSRPGVAVKGFREIDTDEDVFDLDDLEDDGMFRSTVPSKCYMNTSSTYTYTTSNIGLLDNTNLASGSMGPRMTTIPQITTSANTRARVTSTFSTSEGLAQVLKEREIPKTTSIRTKAEASSAPSPRKANIGLNLFAAGKAAEKKAEKSTMPGGVHQVRRGIISRNATPVLSKTADRVLDPETKERLMEKVKAIRAEKRQEHIRKMSLSEGIHTNRTSSLTMSSQVQFKTGAAPGFCTDPSYPTNMMMSMGMSTTTSTSTVSSSLIQPSVGVSPSSGAVPKGTSFYSPSSSQTASQYSSFSSQSASPYSTFSSQSASPYSTFSSQSASPYSTFSSQKASPYNPSAMSTMSSSLLLSSSSSTRTSVLPPPTCSSTPNQSKALPFASDSGLGLASIGSLDKSGDSLGVGLKVASVTSPKVVSGGQGVGLISTTATPPKMALGGQGVGLAGLGDLSATTTPPKVAFGGQGVGLGALSAATPKMASGSQGVGLAALGNLSTADSSSKTTNSRVGLASVGGLNPLGATGSSAGITRATAGTLNPQVSPSVGLGAVGSLSPHGATSPLSVLSGGSLNKNRLPTGRKL